MVEIWKRETPSLPFSFHIYRTIQHAYMVYSSSAVCGETVRSEPIALDLAMRLVGEFRMRLAQ